MGPLEWPLLTGWLPVALLVAVSAAMVFLAASRDRAWWTKILPVVVVASLIAVFAITLVVDRWWRPFPDPLPLLVVAWIWVLLAGLGLALARGRRGGWGSRVVVALCALLVLAGSANQVNRYFGSYPTMAALVGARPAQDTALPSVSASAPIRHVRPDRWRPPTGMRTRGTVSEVVIPAPVSGFSARPGWVYLPPAYWTVQRPSLPLLLLVGGQPGHPRDWLDGGQLIAVMDSFAAAHRGLAPVVVIPDALGSPLANPLCLDSRLGNVDTYLSVDVPAFVTSHLQIDPDRGHWAVGGFSYGGTCAWQLAVRHPSEFPTFLDVSGQQAPTLGSPRLTVDRAFGGDAAAFAAWDPAQTLAGAAHASPLSPRRLRYARTAGVLAVGAADRVYQSQLQRVAASSTAAGISVNWVRVPGQHSWYVATTALARSMPWLATRMGLGK